MNVHMLLIPYYVLASGAARVLGSKFMDDFPLKADLGSSQSLLDTVLCDGT